jgi:hypothetical protein
MSLNNATHPLAIFPSLTKTDYLFLCSSQKPKMRAFREKLTKRRSRSPAEGHTSAFQPATKNSAKSSKGITEQTDHIISATPDATTEGVSAIVPRPKGMQPKLLY